MKAIVGAVVAIAIAIAVWQLWPRDKAATAGDAPTSAKPAAPATDTKPAPAPAPAAKPAVPKHVTKLPSAEERKRVADRIAAARAARTAASANTPAPKLPDEPPGDELPISKETIQDAMKEVHQQLLECYETALPTLKRKDFEVKGEMTLTGDPDVGTLIDAKQLIDDQGNPLDAKLDDCLRSTFQSLELPPLAEGSEVLIKYPFSFSHGDDDGSGH